MSKTTIAIVFAASLTVSFLLSACRITPGPFPEFPVSPGNTTIPGRPDLPSDSPRHRDDYYELFFGKGARALYYIGVALLIFKQWSASAISFLGAFFAPIVGRSVDIFIGQLVLVLTVGVIIGILYAWFRLRSDLISSDDGNFISDLWKRFSRKSE